MARRCSICGKKSMVAITRKKLRQTKYNPTSRKRKYPNLQWVHLSDDKRVKACARCIKTLTKTKTKQKRAVA